MISLFSIDNYSGSVNLTQDVTKPTLVLSDPDPLQIESDIFTLTLDGNDSGGIKNLRINFGKNLLREITYEGIDVSSTELFMTKNTIYYTTVIDLGPFKEINSPESVEITLSDQSDNSQTIIIPVVIDLNLPDVQWVSQESTTHGFNLVWTINDDSEIVSQTLMINELPQILDNKVRNHFANLTLLEINSEQNILFTLIAIDAFDNQNQNQIQVRFIPPVVTISTTSSIDESEPFPDLQFLIPILIAASISLILVGYWMKRSINRIRNKAYRKKIMRIIDNDPFEEVTNIGAEWLIDQGSRHGPLMTLSGELLNNIFVLKSSSFEDLRKNISIFKNELDMLIFNQDVSQGLAQIVRSGFYHWLEQIESNLKA